MTSPICTVNGSSTTNGVDVTQNTTITIQLVDLAGVNTWEITCVGTDELTTPATINASLTITDVINKTATFTMPDYQGCAVILQSRVNQGRDINGAVVTSYTTTFKVDTLVTLSVNRTIAMNETLENNASFGWIGPINQVIRTAITTLETLTGDANGLITNNTVDKIKTKTLATALSSIGAGQDAYNLTWVNSSGEWQAQPSTINGVVVTGTPAVGSTVRATSSTTAAWGQLDLADTDAVTGVLPIGNQAYQTMAGDVSGTTAVSVVDKLKTKSLATALSTIGSTQDGYVLTWVNGSTEWQAKPTAALITLAGDVTGAVGSSSVVKIRGKTLGASLASIGAAQDGYVLVWNNGASEWQSNSNFSTTVITLGGDVTGSSNNNVVEELTGVLVDGYYKVTFQTGTTGIGHSMVLSGQKWTDSGYGAPLITIMGTDTTTSDQAGSVYISGGLAYGGGDNGNIYIGTSPIGSPTYPQTSGINIFSYGSTQIGSYGNLYIRADQSSESHGDGPGNIIFESPTSATAGAIAGYLEVGIWTGGDGGSYSIRKIPYYAV